jgi:hypothetical protein
MNARKRGRLIPLILSEGPAWRRGAEGPLEQPHGEGAFGLLDRFFDSGFALAQDQDGEAARSRSTASLPLLATAMRKAPFHPSRTQRLSR